MEDGDNVVNVRFHPYARARMTERRADRKTELVEDYLLRNSPRFWRLIESRKAQVGKGATLPFDVARYMDDEPMTAKRMTVREKTSAYGTRKRK